MSQPKIPTSKPSPSREGAARVPATQSLSQARSPAAASQIAWREEFKEKDPDRLALSSKFTLTKISNLVVLGTRVESQEAAQASDMSTKSETANTPAGLGDVEAVATTTKVGDSNASKDNGSLGTEDIHKPGDSATEPVHQNQRQSEQSVKMSVPHGQEKSQDTAKHQNELEEKWDQVLQILKGTPEMADDLDGQEELRKWLRSAEAKAARDGKKGSVCANPKCREFGHTLAVCPVPVREKEGDMTGCFFCNTMDHEADECSMMEWVAPATLVTHLITNRAGMPPWRTVIDWVHLAVDNWDLVCFTSLPLTRDFVRKVYIPRELWKQVNGVSPITDPLFKKANRRLLESLAHPPRGSSRVPLVEAALDCRLLRLGEDPSKINLAIYRNQYIHKFAPRIEVEIATPAPFLVIRPSLPLQQAREAQAREQALRELLPPKQQPKKANKGRKGRRAMKKEAQAAAGSAAASTPGATGTDTVAQPSNGANPIATAGPSERPTTPPIYAGQAAERGAIAALEDVPLSSALRNLTDELDDIIENMQKLIKPKSLD